MNEKTLLISFGKNLKLLRIERGMSQEALGHACDLDRTYISGIERGKRNVSLINLSKLAKALNLPIHQLFFRLGE
tara:strand:+ start:427 stop:651 length:225 start_codon:yes stop_codon:yes gene_type:complete